MIGSRPFLLRLFAFVLASFGLVLLIGGVKLLAVGGSRWYACSGTVLMGSAILLWYGNRWGSWLYGLLLAATAAWSFWEVGCTGWALVPRLLLLTGLGLWLLTPWAQRGLTAGPGPLYGGDGVFATRASARIYVLLALVVAATLGVALTQLDPVSHFAPAGSAVAAMAGTAAGNPISGETAGAGDWRHYANDAAGTHYSALMQVNPGNVMRLKLAWSFRTGDRARPGQAYNFEATPLKIDRLLYVCTPTGQVFALDAATGKPVWHFDGRPQLEPGGTFACRGVTYYSTGAPAGTGASDECIKRIYVSTPDAKLWSVDALTGKPCVQFGDGGAVDLLSGLGDVPRDAYSVTSAPVVARGKLVIGAKVKDNVATDMPSGAVRAFDAVTGKLDWAWDVGRPEDKSSPAPGTTYTRSTPNAWAPMTADDALGLVYIPTGNRAVDFWGKNRRSFDEQYGASLVAVDADTGATRWHFQVVHHDLWDNDVSAQPVQVDLSTPAGIQPAVIFGTKQGSLFVLNRKTGAPIVPVTEDPAPGPSNIGEQLAATQPSSAIAVNPGPSRLTEAAMWGMTPVDQMWCRIQFRRARYEGPFTPPGTGQPTIVYPGMFGGIEWGGVTVDPLRQILIANPSAMPFIVRMAAVRETQESGPTNGPHGAEGVPAGLTVMKGSGYAASFFGFLSPLRIPCLQPPWGKIYAIDLQSGKLLWERPVGTARDTGPMGIASRLPMLVGTPQVGGTIVTRSGLIFAAATLDNYLRAYDLRTGEELWKTRLPAGGQATPMTYKSDGRQFIVIAAGGHDVLGTKPGDYVVGYALE